MPEKQPLISIIVPVYNAENYIQECICSILSQTYENIELLLVDDGSTDSSGEICDRYAASSDSRIRVFHKENEGPGESRNVGLDRAKGEWVMFCDADDKLLETDCLAMLLETAFSLQANVVRCDYRAIDEKGKILSWKTEDSRKKRYAEKALTASCFMERIIDREFFSCFTLFRSSIINNYGIRFPRGILFNEDKAFWLFLLPHLKVCVYLAIPLCGYRKYPDSASYRQTQVKVTNMISVLRIIMAQYDLILDAELKNRYAAFLVTSYLRVLIIITADFYEEKQTVVSENKVEGIRSEILAFCRSKGYYTNSLLCYLPVLAVCHLLKLKFRLMAFIWEEHEKIRFLFRIKKKYVDVD
jgi:glycosyltransferase involved in cell wall biosynthesis